MRPRRAAFTFILVTVAFDMLAFGIIAPVLPKLVLTFLGGDTVSAARIFGVFGTLFALMQLVFSPLLGMLSDRYGRRPVIIFSNIGTGLDYLIMALAPSLGWLFAGRIIAGITTASVTTAFAYIADVVPKEKRAGAMGMVGAAFGVGFIVGPALGGVLGNVNPRLPFYVCAGLSLLNALYGYFVLPESLSPEHRQAGMDWKRANPLGSLKILQSHPDLARLALINFIEYIAHEVLPVVFVLYAIARYSWTPAQVGWSLALTGACIAVVQGGLTQAIVARIGERRSLIAGLMLGVIAFACVGLAPTGALMLAAIPLLALWGLAGAPAQSMMTHHVSVSEQGELQGALGSMRSLAMLIGPALFSLVFAYSIDARAHVWQLPGAAWFLAAAPLATTLLLAFGVTQTSIRAADTPAGDAV